MAGEYRTADEPVPGYQLVQFLGRGGYGEVWKASAPGGTECALKIINLGNSKGLKEFRAVRLVKRIRHANLTPIIAFWLKDRLGNILADDAADSTWLKNTQAELILAMGLGDKNLADRLKECQGQGLPGIPSDELLGYMDDAAKAIDYLNQPRHDLGEGIAAVQHCDIKPQNILLVGDSAQVCDFGLARQLNAVLGSSTMVGGTCAYIAPEVIQNKPSKTLDQYGLAISYIELRTGALPFHAATVYEVMLAHIKGRLDFSRLPPGEQLILRRATSVNPDDRFANTQEMVRALRDVLQIRSMGQVILPPQAEPAPVKADLPRPVPVTEPEPFPSLLLAPAPAQTPTAEAEGAPKPGMEIVPGYQLVHFIGRGSYGEVWKAVGPGGKPLAIKIIGNPEAGGDKPDARVLKLLKRVDHHHLTEVHAYWLLDGAGQMLPDREDESDAVARLRTLVIATKLASKNLLQRLEECQQAQGGKGGLPLEELLPYMRQAADAIDHLNTPHHELGSHKVGIQHRDIKPGNLLLAANQIKVSDFGLAKILEGRSAEIEGPSVGITLSYAAPEVFANKVTAWSDQYSLAMTYFHLRVGTMPFQTTSPTQIFIVLVDGLLDLSPLPEAERLVIARSTALNPSERYPSCVAMIDALEQACGRLTDRIQTAKKR